MSEDIKWKKISDKKYQRLVGEEWINVDMPYGKVELIFAEFIGEGGMIDVGTGQIATDLPTLISKFGTIGSIVLTEFDAEGEVSKKGNHKILSPDEIPTLFMIAVNVIENFTSSIQGIKGAALSQEKPGAKGKTPKAKA